MACLADMTAGDLPEDWLVAAGRDTRDASLFERKFWHRPKHRDQPRLAGVFAFITEPNTQADFQAAAKAGIVGSAAIFAVAHGPSVILLDAFLVGILAGILFRKANSIWPAFVLHAVYNGLHRINYAYQ